MPEEKKEKSVKLKEGEVVIDQSILSKVLEQQAATEKKLADLEAKNAGLEEMFAEDQGVSPTGEKKLRERKTFEPKFRTVKLRKYPIGNPDDGKTGFVIGWTDRGAYEKVDRSGINPVVVNYLDVLFLDPETGDYLKTTGEDGKERTYVQQVQILDLLNTGVPVNCKILEEKREKRKVPTGEELHVKTWDPRHGLLETGEVIDGYVGVTDVEYTLQIPGIEKPLKIDQKYVN